MSPTEQAADTLHLIDGPLTYPHGDWMIRLDDKGWSEGDPSDTRQGTATSLGDCKDQIDRREE